MSRTKILYFIIMFIILSIVAFWVVKHFNHRSGVYLISDSLPDNSHIYADVSLDSGEYTERLSASRKPDLSRAVESVGSQANFKILPKPTEENQSELCRWTSQRLNALDIEIRKSGAGSSSQHCEEYDLRRRELVSNQCRSKLERNFLEFC